MGIKAIAIYRDNCKVAQPLSMAKKAGSDKTEPEAEGLADIADSITDKIIVRSAMRRELPRVRTGKTFSFRVADSKGFVTVGEYDDGTPGELFIRIAKQGSTLAGMMDAFARSISYGLQYGVPLKSYVKGFTNMSFAPAGITDDPDIRTASSLVDYIFRRLALSYLSFDDRLELGLASMDDMPPEVIQTSLLEGDEVADTVAEAEAEVEAQEEAEEEMQIRLDAEIRAETMPLNIVSATTADKPTKKSSVQDDDAPMCFNCGNVTQRAGSCYVCTSCGSTTGCS
jgi:ribonucleoside-diphosphate reductase alpha chain